MTISNQPVRTRQEQSLYHALGMQIVDALAQDDVVEVMANPDGSLWVDRMGIGRICIGTIDTAAAEAVIRLLAAHMGDVVTPDRPAVAGVLPQHGERFQGLWPPLVERPCFSIRKRPRVIYTLDDYVQSGILPVQGADLIRQAVKNKRNILVAGGTGSGKTTLVNAILAEPAFQQDRIVLIEDTRELQCSSSDRVELLTKPTEPKVTMTDLLRMTLRLRPDRILIGEVRGGEALDLIKAWNTGHPGGVATIHANSAKDAIRRIEELIGEVTHNIPRHSIAGALNLLVFIERTSCAPYRNVGHMVRVEGFSGQDYQLCEQLL